MTYYVGTFGIPLTIKTYVDLTGYTITIHVKLPDGTVVSTWTVDNVPGASGEIVHTLHATDFTLPGQYVIHWSGVTGATAKIYGDEETISVLSPVA
jgi:hypothetical protein